MMQTKSEEKWVNKAFKSRPQPMRFLFHQYCNNSISNAELGSFTAEQLFGLQNFRNYYYQIDPYNGLPRGRHSTQHFGVTVSNEGSNEFDLGIYINQAINEFLSFCETPEELIKSIKMNLSWHYQKFRELSKLSFFDFNKELETFLDKLPVFTEIYDLDDVRNCAGLYLMVLDDYACCYVGQSKDIKKRILQHWSKTNYGTSGIDMFKALDTTRIFVVVLGDYLNPDSIDKLEYAFIHEIDRKYLLNCHGGGGSLEFIHSDDSFLGYGCDPV